jgi:hypothetical protein
MITIHHGSGVETAIAELLEGKTLIKPPYDDLKVDPVKDLVEAYSQVWPHKNACLLAGPLDAADPSTLDILLKRIEEPFENAPELILWAHDYGSVPETIRSRCSERYHYQPQGQHELYMLGEQLYDAIESSSLVDLSNTLRRVGKGQYRAILEAYVEVLVEREGWEHYTDGLKRLLGRKQMSAVALYGFFLGEDL